MEKGIKDKYLYKMGHGYGHWVEILNKKAVAPENDVYCFICFDNNHYKYPVSVCSSRDNLCVAAIRTYNQYIPDSLDSSEPFLVFHLVMEYGPEGMKFWKEYNLGDKAPINGIYLWYVRKMV